MLRSGLQVAKRTLQTGLNENSIVVLDSCRIPFLKSQSEYRLEFKYPDLF